MNCSDDKTIRLWNLNTGQQIKQFNGHSYVLGLCKVDKNVFVSAGGDKSIKIWNMASDTCIHTMDNTHEKWIFSLLYSASNQVLISASWDKTVKIWDLKMGEANKKIDKCTLKFTINNPFNNKCCSLAFLDGENGGSRVLVGDYGGNMFIVDLKTGTCINKIEKVHSSWINKLAVG